MLTEARKEQIALMEEKKNLQEEKERFEIDKRKQLEEERSKIIEEAKKQASEEQASIIAQGVTVPFLVDKPVFLYTVFLLWKLS